MQQRGAVGMALQAALEEFGEQVVVAEPFTLLVQGDDEELLALQAHQHVQAIAAAGQGVAQVGAELVEHRGLVKELLQGQGQAVDHVLGQVVGDIALGTAEAGEEGLAVRVPRQGQAGQVQRGDPALGTGMQLLQLAAAQLQLADLAEIRLGFLEGQAQVFGLQREGLALDEQAARGEAGGADQVHVARQALDQVAGALLQAGVADAMEVVEHHVELAVEALQVTDEGVDDRLHRPVHLTPQQPGGVAAEARLHRLDRSDQVLQQALGLAVGIIAGQPGDPRTGLLQLLAEQAEHGALAEPGRGAEHHHTLAASLEQPVDQGLARQAWTAAGIRREELGTQHREGQRIVGRGAHASSSPSSRARRIAWVRLRTLSFS